MSNRIEQVPSGTGASVGGEESSYEAVIVPLPDTEATKLFAEAARVLGEQVTTLAVETQTK